MHFNTAQSRSAWTEQEDELLRQAVAKFGDRAWATVANDVPGRSSKSCSDRWRNFLSPDIEHPRKSPFTEWEVAVVVQAQHRYGNNWKAISMLLPGRTNRAVKNLFVGNLKWGARLPEIKNRWLECNMSLEELLEIKPDHAGGPVKIRNGSTIPAASGSPSSIRAASTSSAGSAWASDITDQPLSGSPASAGTHHGGDRRKRGDGTDMHMGMAAGQSPPLSKRRRGVPSPVMPPHHHHLQHGAASYSPTVVPHPGALGPGASGSPMLGMPGLAAGDMAGLVGSMGPPAHSHHGAHGLGNNAGMLLQGHALHVMDEGSPALAAGAYGRTPGAASLARSMAGAGIPGLPHTPSHHPSGMPLPPRSASATGSGLAAFPGPEGCQAPPAGWAWGPVSAGHSLPGSGPPSTGGGMPPQPHLHVICHQLQQENIKLMQRVHTLQNRLNSSGEQLPTAAELGICLPGDQQAAETPAAPAPTPAGGCGVACVPTPALAGGSLASDPAPGQAAAQQAMMQLSPVNAVAVNSSYPADNDLPRLPPVATRVGGSAGGAGHGGWATGGLDSRGSGLAGLGSGGLGLGSGSSGLGGLKVELQVSPDGSFTPGQLLEGCMVDALISDDL
ncbi:hypothetical protein OEZ86_014612 [Tetradesmus obliquus]|nr:hypothetical protein OEZ86_014612 [Tetradesmus obliquus]